MNKPESPYKFNQKQKIKTENTNPLMIKVENKIRKKISKHK
jgi:hypothetical protein